MNDILSFMQAHLDLYNIAHAKKSDATGKEINLLMIAQICINCVLITGKMQSM